MGTVDGPRETSRKQIAELIDADLATHAARLEQEARHYAAVLYAITSKRPDIPAEERAALAAAIVETLHVRAAERSRWPHNQGDHKMARQKGERVGAILGSDGKIVRLLGYGVYEGDDIPPASIGGFNVPGMPNPKLLLDGGKVVWGCECWWGSEGAVKKRIEEWRSLGYEIENTDIDAARAAAGKVGPA